MRTLGDARCIVWIVPVLASIGPALEGSAIVVALLLLAVLLRNP
jgi:hypothetical protein